MTIRRSISLLIGTAVLAATFPARAAPPRVLPSAAGVSGGAIDEESVAKAIAGAVKYIYAQANQHGIWDDPQPPEGARTHSYIGANMKNNWGGVTALMLCALASAGQKADPRFHKALGWMMKQDLFGTYAVGLRLSLIHELGNSGKYRRVLRRDVRLLLKGARLSRFGVTWQYLAPPHGSQYNAGKVRGDYSNVNYAVLGMWAASDEGAEIPGELWRRLEQIWCVGQQKNGGWSYFPAQYNGVPMHGEWKEITSSMTTAGIATLYLILDRAHSRRGGLGGFRKTPAYKSIGRGLDWMEKNFSTRNLGRPRFSTYYFYNLERVAAASGLKYFGTHDWFREVTAVILSKQSPDGGINIGWPARVGGPKVDAAYCLLFLTKGSGPVIFNKLQHSGDWDNRIRDLAGLAAWVSRQSERPANWQVVNLRVAPEELTDSRILYIAGTRPLKFLDAEKAKLKRYVELGGLLVFHPDAPAPEFNSSAKKLLGELWPKLELTPVDTRTHPIGKAYGKLTNRIRLQQLASPTRVLAFVVHGQPAWAWARRQFRQAKHAFDVGAALHYFANDRAHLKEMPTRLTYFAEDVRRPAPAVRRTVTLARIRYDDNPHRWDPEPAAFELLARRMATREKIGLHVKVVTPDLLAMTKAKVAHLTGVDAVEFARADWDAIDAWIKAGGTLIVDQAGGPPRGRTGAFDDAFRKLIARRYGDEALEWVVAQAWLKGVDKVGYRNVAGMRRRRMGPRLESVRIGDREAILYSRDDLTCGLLGNPNPLVAGADADGAYAIVSRLLLGAAGITPEALKPSLTP